MMFGIATINYGPLGAYELRMDREARVQLEKIAAEWPMRTAGLRPGPDVRPWYPLRIQGIGSLRASANGKPDHD